MDGLLISPALEKQIRRVVRDWLTAHWNVNEMMQSRQVRQPSRFRPRAVITDAAISGPNFLDTPAGSIDPSQPNATVCRMNPDTGKYEQTSDRLAVAVFVAHDVEADTPGVAIPVDGMYWLFAACEPMTDRPTPPWQE